MHETLPRSRRHRLPSAAPPAACPPSRRAASPGAAETAEIHSAPAIFKRSLSVHSQSRPCSQHGSPSHGRPMLCRPNSRIPICHVTVSPRLRNAVGGSQAHSPSSSKRSLSRTPLDRNVTTSEGGNAHGLTKHQKQEHNMQTASSRRASTVGKSAEKNQKTGTNRSSESKSVGNEVVPALATTTASQNSVEVIQGAEIGLSKTHLSEQPIAKPRSEKVGSRGCRRGWHISDVSSRRNLTYGTHPSKMHAQRRRRAINSSKNQFPLNSLEEYIQQRGWTARDAMQNFEDINAMNSHLASLGNGSTLSKCFQSDCVSADEAENVLSQIDSDRSGYPVSLCQQPENRMLKNDTLLHYAGNCFNVSRRRAYGRRNRLGYICNSERSISSYDSDTEMVPLMTDPEPFHEFSNDESDSSMDEDITHLLGELTFNGYKDMRSHNNKLNLLGYKDAYPHEAASAVQGLLMRGPKDMACKPRSISQKYRPKSLKDVLGQNMVVESLSNAILRSKIAPVYLFHGPRGTGKTTVAKIFTCAINCLSIEELRPCGSCHECSSFLSGNNYDVKEVDAAGNNELESMKQVLKHLALPPSKSRYKVFIMDDCHMLTPEAWNALLKSLEEPPDYVVFILITTDLEQLPRGAISRCQKFMFNRIKDADIAFKLRKLAQQENVDINADALQFIAAHSDGSLRDAETMLDQLSLLGKRITLQIVRETVGLIPEEELINILEMVLCADTLHIVNKIRELMGSGIEPQALISQLATLIMDTLAGRCQISRYSGMGVKIDQQQKLQEALKVLSELEHQLHSCSDRTTWVTAAFLQLASTSSCPSSRNISVPQSPAAVQEGSEKGIFNFDGMDQKLACGRKERQEGHATLHADGLHMDNKIYPCDHSPRLGASIDQKPIYRLLHETQYDVRDKSRCSNLSPCAMDVIWQKVLHGMPSNMLKQLLEREGKLVALRISEGHAIARLEFKSWEQKTIAERAVQRISSTFQGTLLCPVRIEIGLSSQWQGRISFVNRGDDHSTQSHTENYSNQTYFVNEVSYWHEEGNRGNSSRKSSTSSSFRKIESAPSSPRHHGSNHQKFVHVDASPYGKGNINTSAWDSQVYKGHGDLAFTTLHLEENDSGYASEHKKPKEERASFEDLRFTRPLQWREMDYAEYSSDSEVDGRYEPGLLCWRGTRVKEERGKQHVLRRRKGGFLLKLVPCATKEEEDVKKGEV
ncbi:hypothetical protein KP509_18G081700 [Ceratopteris richardii]|uniref:DNA-directed DNA polymerase n=1 Tax=Ceratopteris richardii TaxID=49495 RepID=A0A8T2STL0_CERRI|nr:hypothetical protein KP509_18G081700 [Ceratopteris richardii]